MKYFSWNEDKNRELKEKRGITFEEVVAAINNGYLLAIEKHANEIKYPNQKILIVKIKDYVYLVPYVEDKDKYFLKSIFPSRKATRKYIYQK